MEIKTITVNGEDYFMIYDEEKCGSAFTTRGMEGPASIIIGTQNSRLKDIVSDIAHELMELICTVDGKRWSDMYSKDADAGVIFCFDHGYFKLMIPKLIDALINTGVIKLDKQESNKRISETKEGALRAMQEEGAGHEVPDNARKDSLQ